MTRKPGRYEPITPKLDVHQAITDKIVTAIEAGAGAFEMPWHRPGISSQLPKNALTGKPYRGSNILSLWIDATTKAFEHPRWATFKQWQELGAQVRKGEKGSLIVKYGEWRPRDAKTDTPSNAAQSDRDGDDTKRMFAKAAYVFNAAQIDGDTIEPETPRLDLTTRLAHVDDFIAATKADYREGGQRAFYRHRDQNGDGDFIQIPDRTLFIGTDTSTPTESFESTRLHELCHWSGASHRLDRTFGERFADHAYAFEELVAELGAAFLCAQLDVTNTPRADHAQYVAHWLDVLKTDKRAIFSAASLASQAVAYLDGFQPATHDASPPPRHDSPPSRPLGDGEATGATRTASL